MLDDSISVLVCVFRHSFLSTRFRLFVPVQRALFPKIEVTNQQDGDVYHHFQKTVPSQTAKNVGPWVEKNGFHIEQNENHCYEIKFYRERLASIAGRLHATFVSLQLSLGRAPPADDLGKTGDNPSKKRGNQELYD